MTSIKKIIVRLPKLSKLTYPILVGNGLLDNWNQWLLQYCIAKQIVVITDDIVKGLFVNKFVDELRGSGYKVLLLSIKSGEASKVNRTKEYLELQMLKSKCDKHTLLLAFGGGVVGDLAGFIAATYMRGISYIQIPTTLLSMLDSSVGGKTGINTPYGKNLIGSFWQPQAVIVDLNLLHGLSKVQIINGLVEALKIFIIFDAKAFDYVKANIGQILSGDYTKLCFIINKAIRIKLSVVILDEREKNLRMVLNFGHTIGHALEKIIKFQILHGYAVGLGILVESKIAQLRGILSNANYALIEDVFANIGISRDMLASIEINKLAKATLGDKKNQCGKIYCILPKSIGEIYTATNNLVATEVSINEIKQAFICLVG